MGPASAANVLVGLVERRRARHPLRTSSWVSLGGEGPGIGRERDRLERAAAVYRAGRPVNLAAISGRQRGEKFFVTGSGGSSLTR
jgi:hypothetical protein